MTHTLLNASGLFLTPAPVRHTRDEAQAEMGVTFNQIEHAARLCAADNGPPPTPAVLGATLHASYFQRLLYQDAHAFENACVVFLPDALAHHAPALAHATDGGTCTEWNVSETVCTAYWCRHLGGKSLSGRATDASLPLQFWVELNEEQTVFLPHTQEGPSLLHTLFVTRDEVWVAAQWLHVGDLVRFSNAIWRARNITAHTLQHIGGCPQQGDTTWMQGICPVQLRQTVDRPAQRVNVLGCRLHHVYTV